MQVSSVLLCGCGGVVFVWGWVVDAGVWMVKVGPCEVCWFGLDWVWCGADVVHPQGPLEVLEGFVWVLAT